MISKVIDNKYLIVKYLGRGSFSKTWMIYDYIDDRFLALKLFENNFFEEFEIELNNFKKLKGVTHPNIINFYGDIQCKIDEKLAKGLILELLGDSVELLLDKEYDNRLNPSIIKKLSKDILNGLEFLHSNGLVHNDMKFDNILITTHNKKIQEYIERITRLEINKYYLDTIEELTPNEIKLLDKKKKKIVKRKIREKANKETTRKFRNEIIKINNSSLENLKLSIEEIEQTEEPQTTEEPKLEETY